MKSASLPKFESLKKVHIIGVCGTLMGAFASFLKRSGIEVTGSDQNVYPPMSDVLREAGVELITGYSAANLSRGSRPDLVVIGNVIRSDNPEAVEAIQGGFAYASLPQAMEELLLPDTRNLVVAGTHGKTTTASMLAFVLSHCGQDPNYFIGGVLKDLPHSFHVSSIKDGRCFVLEGDEYDTAFWDKVPKFNHYLPDDVILTSIEFDHADIYPNLEAVKRAFDGLRQRMRAGGRLIACFDYASVKEFAERAKTQVLSYASSATSGARYYPVNIRNIGGLTHFDLVDGREGKTLAKLKLQLPGNHNVLNAIAVWLECRELGLDPARVADALSLFQGVKRRQEERGEVRGVLVIDDFAHHPTAVRETLRALRLKYSQRRIIAVFEPRSATSRRKVFQKEYGEAFLEADEVFISSPYDQSRIAVDDQFSSEELVADLIREGRPAYLFAAVEEGVAQISSNSRSGDLVAVLSNGGFGGLIPKLLEKLSSSN